MKKWLIGAVVVLLMVVGFGWNQYGKVKDEAARLEQNQAALLQDVEVYKTESGKNAAAVKMLTLDKEEAEKYCEELCDVIDDLNVKLKRVEEATKTETKTEVQIKTIVKDSIVYVDSSAMKVQAFGWKDNWTKIDGYLHGDSANINIENNDSLYMVVHRVPKKWWFFRWGTKELKVDVVNTNPHTNIKYVRTLRVKD